MKPSEIFTGHLIQGGLADSGTVGHVRQDAATTILPIATIQPFVPVPACRTVTHAVTGFAVAVTGILRVFTIAAM